MIQLKSLRRGSNQKKKSDDELCHCNCELITDLCVGSFYEYVASRQF